MPARAFCLLNSIREVGREELPAKVRLNAREGILFIEPNPSRWNVDQTPISS